jgi:hypothetical protein
MQNAELEILGIPRPLRGATRPYVSAGTAIDIWVSTRAFPRAGIVVLTALHRLLDLENI